MARRPPTRKNPKFRKALRRYRLDAVFWGLFAFALIFSGRDAIEGFPQLAGMFLPSLPWANARIETAPQAFGTLSQPLPAGSKYAPQVLQPVQSGMIPKWMSERRAEAVLPQSNSARWPKIAIVIDDVGGDVEQSRRAVALPAAVSLSFLPYPAMAPELAQAAHREGHEVLVHVPMQPEGHEDPGPNALRTDLSAAENVRRLEYNLSRIAGFDGINNHEGSRFTADRAALAPVMAVLAERGVFFLDSRTTAGSEGVRAARAAGVMSVGRDVFLDDTDKPDAIDAQLRATESVARAQGVAIAIGHPRKNTLDALWRWSGEITSRGYQLVPVREALWLKSERETREAARH